MIIDTDICTYIYKCFITFITVIWCVGIYNVSAKKIKPNCIFTNYIRTNHKRTNIYNIVKQHSSCTGVTKKRKTMARYLRMMFVGMMGRI